MDGQMTTHDKRPTLSLQLSSQPKKVTFYKTCTVYCC